MFTDKNRSLSQFGAEKNALPTKPDTQILGKTDRRTEKSNHRVASLFIFHLY